MRAATGLSPWVRGSKGAAFSLDRAQDERMGLYSLIVQGPDQIITVRSRYGELFSFNLINAAHVDEMNIDFIAQMGRSTYVTTPGQKMPYPGFIYMSVETKLFAQGSPICGSYNANLFSFESLTPETCTKSDQFESIYGKATGICSMRLSGPSFNEGRGLARELSIELTK